MGEGVPARMPGFRARCARARVLPVAAGGAARHVVAVTRHPITGLAFDEARLAWSTRCGGLHSVVLPTRAGFAALRCPRPDHPRLLALGGRLAALFSVTGRTGRVVTTFVDRAMEPVRQTQGFRLPGTGCPRPGWRVTGAAGDGEVLVWSLVRKRTAGTCSGPLARRLGFPAQPARREEPAGDRPGEEGRCGPTDGAGRGVRGSRRHARRHLLADGERARRGRVQDPGSRPRAERWGREADLVVRPRHRGLRRLGRGARVNGAVDRRHREQGRLPGRKRDLDPAAQRRPHPAGLHRSRDAPPGADRGGTSSPGTRRRVGDRLSRR